MIATAAAVLVAAAGIATGPGARAGELKLAHFMSPRHPMHRFVFEPLAKELAAATGGKLTIRIYPGGELGKGPKAQYKRAVDGVADITFGLHGYTSSRFPRTLLIELPGVSDGPIDATNMLWNAFDKYLASEYKGTKVLGLWTNAPAVIITRDKPVRSPDDLKGLKIRVPSALAAKVIRSWGGTPVPMPVPKVYNALKTGVIDGVFIGPSAIFSFKLAEVGNYLTLGLPTNVAGFYLVMNRGTWDRLSADEQAAVRKVTGRAMSLKAAEAYRKAGQKGLSFFEKKAKKTIIRLTPAEKARFSATVKSVVDGVVRDLEGKGIPAGKILAAMKTSG